MRTVFLALTLVATPLVRAQAPVGDWSGTLSFGEQSLEMVLHVADAGDSLSVTLDVPAQGGFGIPAASAVVRRDSLLVGYPAFNARFALAVAPDSLHGTFVQGVSLPITMRPAQPLRRPQTPVGPFPYTEEDATVDVDGATLAGTFVRPAGDGPFPAVLFLSGSGAQDRDEALFGHRPFAVVADALARAGVASLRLDDRGEGASTGDFAAATLETHLADARAARAWLAARPDVRAVGVLGHSQGGLTAVQLAPDVAFVVALAAPAVRGTDLYALQHERLARLAGVDSADASAYGRAIAATVAPLLQMPGVPDSVLAATMAAALNEGLRPIPTASRSKLGLAGPTYLQARDQLVQALLSPGLRSFLTHDPAPDLAAVEVPTLMLFGGRDFQVPADQSAPVARAALAGVPGAEVVVVGDANHLFQTAETGGVSEYGTLEETIAPATLARIVDWISAAARRWFVSEVRASGPPRSRARPTDPRTQGAARKRPAPRPAA